MRASDKIWKPASPRISPTSNFALRLVAEKLKRDPTPEQYILQPS